MSASLWESKQIRLANIKYYVKEGLRFGEKIIVL